MNLKPETFLSTGSLLLSLISIITMFVLVGSNNKYNQYIQDVQTLNENVTNVRNNIPATLACQEMIPELYNEYLLCIDEGNMECGTKNSQIINLQTQIANLNATKDQIQGYCTNRTNQLMSEIANFTSDENVTVIQSGSVSVSVTGASNFNANYVWKRSVLKGELKIDILILKAWSNTVNTLATNPIVKYNGLNFVQSNGIVPLYTQYFLGANVTGRRGVEFYVQGTVNPVLQLSTDISIILQK